MPSSSAPWAASRCPTRSSGWPEPARATVTGSCLPAEPSTTSVPPGSRATPPTRRWPTRSSPWRTELDRPDEAAVSCGAAERDEFLHGQGNLAGVETGAGGELIRVGSLTGERFED